MKDSNFLKENNARHLWHPMGHPGDIRENVPTIITGAEGVNISDIDGHSVVDAVGGLWCANLGYSCEPIKKAISDQLQTLPYYSAFAGTTNDAAIEASYALMELFAPDGLTRAFMTSGGSDSVETSLRLARQYHKVRGEHQRTKFMSLKKGYHGTHFGGASVNGNNRFRISYEPLLPGCFHLTAPYEYRNPFNETDPEKLADLIVAEAADEIAFQGPDTIAAFIMEPILGAGGVLVPHASFMGKMKALCESHGILMIADEVICGFGRTGDWTGSRHWGVQPDMMTCAKGITSAYYPVGAAMIAEHVAETFESGGADAGIYHGYTYSAHPVGSAAVVATLSELTRIDPRANAKKQGDTLFNGLKALAEKYDIIGDVRGGHGLMTGMEIVSDKATKAPMDNATMARIQKATYEAGTMVRISGPNILMSPPLILTDADSQTILSSLEAGLRAA